MSKIANDVSVTEIVDTILRYALVLPNTTSNRPRMIEPKVIASNHSAAVISQKTYHIIPAKTISSNEIDNEFLPYVKFTGPYKDVRINRLGHVHVPLLQSKFPRPHTYTA